MEILDLLKLSAIEISRELQFSDAKTLSKYINKENKSGESIKYLDFFSNLTIINNLRKSNSIRKIASEEEDDYINVNKNGEYMVSFDPLDGSSNIDVNVTIGTIFCIYKYNNNEIMDGNNIVMAGYFLYGTSTLMVVTENSKINKYILNKNNEFILSQSDIKIPTAGPYFSINYANYSNLINKSTQEYLDKLIRLNYSHRYVGSLVADAHRTLIKGGVFLYPLDKKYKKGKIRLLYEAYPMAYIFKIAGGCSSNEQINILDIPFPTDLHEKTSIILLGNKEMEIYEKFC